MSIKTHLENNSAAGARQTLIWGAALTAAFACAAASPPFQAPTTAVAPRPAEVSEASAYEERILWRRLGDLRASFIPQQVWATTPLDELPISDSEMETLNYALGKGEAAPSGALGLMIRRYPQLDRRIWSSVQSEKHAVPIRDCEVPQLFFRSIERTPEGPPISLSSLVHRYDVGFLGEIVAVVSGASPSGGPHEAVYLLVRQVLQDRRGELRTGMVIPRLRSTGSVFIQSQELCKERPSTLEPTALGDTVLIGGTLGRGDSRELDTGYELRVLQGVIQPASSLNLRDELPKSLARLREEYQGDPLEGVKP